MEIRQEAGDMPLKKVLGILLAGRLSIQAMNWCVPSLEAQAAGWEKNARTRNYAIQTSVPGDGGSVRWPEWWEGCLTRAATGRASSRTSIGTYEEGDQGGGQERGKGKVDTPQGGAMWVRLTPGRTKERREREAQDTRRVEGRIDNHQGRDEIC